MGYGSSVARFEFHLRTGASPDAVRAALLDFSERRPELWPGLPRDQYRVYEVGDTWAEVREGYRGPIWNRERYDWSVPGRVQFTAVDSGFAMPGKRVVMDIEAAPGGGSSVHTVWEGSGKGAFGRLFLGFMALTRGYFIRRSIQMGLDEIERHET
jgi:polyketide cyclase/dehydrase/lipid transport protein